MDSWTLWSEQQPTDAKLVYRWRIPAQEILGLVLQPEWSEKLFSPLCQPDIYPTRRKTSPLRGRI